MQILEELNKWANAQKFRCKNGNVWCHPGNIDLTFKFTMNGDWCNATVRYEGFEIVLGSHSIVQIKSFLEKTLRRIEESYH